MKVENITKPLVIGSDHQFILHLLNEAETTAIDMTGWTVSLMLKRELTDLDAAALWTKVATVAGVFNSAPASNAQRATATITDTESGALSPETVHLEWKRTDDGFETPLRRGTLPVVQGVHR